LNAAPRQSLLLKLPAMRALSSRARASSCALSFGLAADLGEALAASSRTAAAARSTARCAVVFIIGTSIRTVCSIDVIRERSAALSGTAAPFTANPPLRISIR
jgi:hypothetical protein